MLQDRGWFERQVKQLADAIARVLRLRKEKQLEQARATIDETHEDLFGILPHVLDALDVRSAAHLLATNERLLAWAELLDVRAGLADDEGQADRAAWLRTRAGEARALAAESRPEP